MARPAPSSDPADLISVIVPIYNVAGQVARCIDSLRAQTHADIDVLMIDDGSTDGSGEIAQRTAGDDPRFRLVRQDNGGLSAARNRGLELARGALVAFVDGDDRVAPDFLEVMARALSAAKADWVACAVRNHYPDGGQTVHSAIHGAADISLYPGPTRFRFDTAPDVIRHFPSAWNKLYRRSLIGDIRFDEGTLFEDHGFFHRLAARTDHILHLPHALYHQTRGRPGQITEADDDRVFDQFAVLDTVLPLVRARPGGDRAANLLTSRLLFERSTALRTPDRRRAFAEAARAYLDANGLRYMPDPPNGIGQAWELEMQGACLLSASSRLLDNIQTALLG